MMEIKEFRQSLERLKGKRDQLLNNIKETESAINKEKREVRNTEDAQMIVQAVAKQTQQELEYHISELVSLALASIYDNPYIFKLYFVSRRGKTEADPLFIRDGKEYKPGKQTGYGPVEVAAFALRVAIWNIKRPRSRNVLILDEPFASLDSSAQPKIGRLLKTLSEKLNLQIIMTSHNNVLIKEMDRIFETSIHKGITTINKLK